MLQLDRTTGRNVARRFEDAGLLIVLVATLVAGVQEIWHMIEMRGVHLTDLLLLFIYLEVVAMVRIYWDLGKLPVRMPIYIAMIALARHIILTNEASEPALVLALAAAVLILALAVLVVRYGHLRFPYDTPPGD